MNTAFNLIINSLIFVALSFAIIVLALFASTLWKKLQVAAGMTIQCSSGDSEVMSFNYNFNHGESDETKEFRMKEAWDFIQHRRDENHAKWLEMKAKAMAENEQKDPDDLKLRSITEGKN